MTPERLDWHLENWAQWMRRDPIKLSYPSKSLMFTGGGAIGEDDSDILADNADSIAAESMDSIIDSISLPRRTAINHVWLSVSHHYPTQELDYDEALTAIVKLANKRGIA